MKAVLDTNVIVSYLLSPSGDSAASVVVRLALESAFPLVLSERVIEEALHSVATKSFLAARVRAEDAEILGSMLSSVAEGIISSSGTHPSVVRDQNDDFFVDPRLLAGVSYLVTGDKDLLILHSIGSTQIVTPREFLGLLALERD